MWLAYDAEHDAFFIFLKRGNWWVSANSNEVVEFYRYDLNGWEQLEIQHARLRYPPHPTLHTDEKSSTLNLRYTQIDSFIESTHVAVCGFSILSLYIETWRARNVYCIKACQYASSISVLEQWLSEFRLNIEKGILPQFFRLAAVTLSCNFESIFYIYKKVICYTITATNLKCRSIRFLACVVNGTKALRKIVRYR